MAIGTATALALAAGAGLGAAKGAKNKAENKRDRFIRAETIRNSPWTGMKDPGETQRAGMLESMLQGGLTGAIMGQALPAGGLGASAPIQTSALGGNVLNQQLTNPALQNAWAGINPSMVA